MLQQDEMLHATAQFCSRDIDGILYQYDPFIRALAQKHIPRSIFRREVLELEIDDLAQITRFRLWQALQKQHIRNMKAFIRCIVSNEVIDMMRRHRPILPFYVDEDGELPQAFIVITYGQGIEDPVEVVEQEEMLYSYSSNLIKDVQALPKQQQRAMLCMLKDKISDILSVVDMFEPYGIDVESITWPATEKELRSAYVSLSLARKKLRASKRLRATSTLNL